jgi:hypothetical protein
MLATADGKHQCVYTKTEGVSHTTLVIPIAFNETGMVDLGPQIPSSVFLPVSCVSPRAILPEVLCAATSVVPASEPVVSRLVLCDRQISPFTIKRAESDRPPSAPASSSGKAIPMHLLDKLHYKALGHLHSASRPCDDPTLHLGGLKGGFSPRGQDLGFLCPA